MVLAVTVFGIKDSKEMDGERLGGIERVQGNIDKGMHIRNRLAKKVTVEPLQGVQVEQDRSVGDSVESGFNRKGSTDGCRDEGTQGVAVVRRMM